MEYTMKLTKIVGDIVNIVRNFFGVDFDEESISYNRFITHIQFFAQRVVQGIKQTDDDLFCMTKFSNLIPKLLSVPTVLEITSNLFIILI